MSAQQKEDRLFENIYLSYFPKMKRFAQEYVISEQDAENIVQDMFAELWEKREMFTCQTIRIAYLFTIIKNKCLNHLRHKTIALETINNMQEEYNMTLRMNLDSLEAFEQHIFSDQDIEDLINRALDSLPTKCKEIFIMNKLEGKKQEQIATELNLSTNTVRNQISIASFMAFPFSLHIESRRCLRVTVWGRDDESEIQRKKMIFFWYIFPE